MYDPATMAPWTLDHYAHRLQRRGHRRVHLHDDVWWTGHNQHAICHTLDPYVRPPRGARPAWRHSYLGYRHLTEDPAETNAYYNPMILDDLPHYGFEQLSERRRRSVRKGLKHVTVRPVTVEDLLRDGWRIEHEGYERNGWRAPPPPARWSAHVETMCREPVIDHKVGAFVDERLVAYVCWYGVAYPSLHGVGAAHLPHLCASDEGTRLAAIDAIVFTLLSALRDSGLYERVQNTIHSHRPSLDAFKESHGFRMQSLGARLTLRPIVRPLLRRLKPASLELLVGLDRDATQRWIDAAKAPPPAAAAG